MWTSFQTDRRDVHPFGSCERHSKLTEEMYIPLVHVNVILNWQKRCTSLWFMWTSFWTDRRDVHPFGSCERHSKLTEEMYIPLVHVNVILNWQKRCTSLWFMWTSFWTDRRDVHPFGSCGRHPKLTEEMYIPLVHVNVIPNWQKRCNPFETDTKGRPFVVDVSTNRPSNRNGQTTVLDSWEVTQLKWLRQRSVKYYVLPTALPASTIIGSALGLVGPIFVNCYRMRW